MGAKSCQEPPPSPALAPENSSAARRAARTASSANCTSRRASSSSRWGMASSRISRSARSSATRAAALRASASATAKLARAASSGEEGDGKSEARSCPFRTVATGRGSPCAGDSIRPGTGAPTSAEPLGGVSTMPATGMEAASLPSVANAVANGTPPLLLLEELDEARFVRVPTRAARLLDVGKHVQLDALDGAGDRTTGDQAASVLAGSRRRQREAEDAGPDGFAGLGAEDRWLVQFERQFALLERAEPIEHGQVREDRDLLAGDRGRVLREQLDGIAPPGDPDYGIAPMPVAFLVVVVPRSMFRRVVVRSLVSLAPQQLRPGEERERGAALHSKSPLAARSAISARLAASARSRRLNCTAARARSASSSSRIDILPSRYPLSAARISRAVRSAVVSSKPRAPPSKA